MHPKCVDEAIDVAVAIRTLPESVNSDINKIWLNSLTFGDFLASKYKYKKKQKQTLLLWLLLLLLLLLISEKLHFLAKILGL